MASKFTQKTVRASGGYNITVRGYKHKLWPVTMRISMRRGRPLLRVSNDYLYFSIPRAAARDLVAALKKMEK